MGSQLRIKAYSFLQFINPGPTQGFPAWPTDQQFIPFYPIVCHPGIVHGGFLKEPTAPPQAPHPSEANLSSVLFPNPPPPASPPHPHRHGGSLQDKELSSGLQGCPNKVSSSALPPPHIPAASPLQTSFLLFSTPFVMFVKRKCFPQVSKMCSSN